MDVFVQMQKQADAKIAAAWRQYRQMLRTILTGTVDTGEFQAVLVLLQKSPADAQRDVEMIRRAEALKIVAAQLPSASAAYQEAVQNLKPAYDAMLAANAAHETARGNEWGASHDVRRATTAKLDLQDLQRKYPDLLSDDPTPAPAPAPTPAAPSDPVGGRSSVRRAAR